MYDPRSPTFAAAPALHRANLKGVNATTIVENDLSIWVIALAALAILLELIIMRWRRET